MHTLRPLRQPPTPSGHALPGGKRDKPRGNTQKNVGRVQPAEQHTIAGIHFERVINTMERVRRAWIIDEASEISSQAFVRRRFTFLTYGPIYRFIQPYIGADARPISAGSRSITQCFLSPLGELGKSSNKGLALQAQKVLDNGTRRRQGLRQVYQKCRIGMVAVSMIVII